MTQQIHSLRASGVISSHFARAAGSEMRTFRKSAGTACTAPRETALLVMDFSLYPTGVVLVRVVGKPEAIRVGPWADLLNCEHHPGAEYGVSLSCQEGLEQIRKALRRVLSITMH